MSTIILRVALTEIPAVVPEDAKAPVYRDIEVPADFVLSELAGAILEAYDFEFDHPFGFYGDLGPEFLKSDEAYELFADVGEVEPGSKAREVGTNSVATVFPEDGKTMLFLFDYGESWTFWVRRIGFGQISGRKGFPILLDSEGDAPSQYGDLDDGYDDDYEDGDVVDMAQSTFEIKGEIKGAIEAISGLLNDAPGLERSDLDPQYPAWDWFGEKAPGEDEAPYAEINLDPDEGIVYADMTVADADAAEKMILGLLGDRVGKPERTTGQIVIPSEERLSAMGFDFGDED